MSLWEMLQLEYVRYALVSAAVVGVVCSLLSVVVVLKRMAFIGQGVSHAGFGGLGVATVLGFTGLSADLTVLGFCLGTALLIGCLVRSKRVEADTAIGILLVFAMAFGVAMYHLRVYLQQYPAYYEWVGGATYTIPWEQLLFGSPLTAGLSGMWWSIGMAVVVLGVCAAVFKELLFIAFDEPAAGVFGVRSGAMYYLLLAILALVVVVGMRLVGFLLVTALLMIPGSAAMMLSRRLTTVLCWSAVIGLAGTLGGLVLSLGVGDLSPGAAIVLVLVALFLVAGGVGRLRGTGVAAA